MRGTDFEIFARTHRICARGWVRGSVTFPRGGARELRGGLRTSGDGLTGGGLATHVAELRLPQGQNHISGRAWPLLVADGKTPTPQPNMRQCRRRFGAVAPSQKNDLSGSLATSNNMDLTPAFALD